MSNKEINYDARSFIIRGNRELLIGGEFHYFRTPNELWEDRIIKMKRSGSNLVATYIPWNWHEQFEGEKCWEGDHDLVRFIELCTKHDMFVIVKPGPYCCAELDFGGHPDWLLSKKIPLRVLNDQYLDYVKKWYKKVAEVINPYLVTNGGNVFCIQVENEYDHLLEYGDDKIPLSDAIKYFKILESMMNEFNINIPKFANEAMFLRGHGIIDTRTYYPNIPFFRNWEWEFEHYDNKIISAKTEQPDCPTMIMELQKGWFGMHGHPFYFPELKHTQGVMKTSLILSASVLNLYMFTGGTTFPFWGSRGNAWALDRWSNKLFLNPIGTGLTTTFDFGGSVVREWGELLPECYDWIKAFNLFAKDYKNLILESDDTDAIDVFSGGDDIRIIYNGKSELDTKLQHEMEKFKVITKKYKNQYLTCVRNLSDTPKTANIGWKESKEVIFKDFFIPPHTTYLLPVNIKIPDTDIVIKHSTSELLFTQKRKQSTMFGLYGEPEQTGETVLKLSMFDVKVISGNISVTGSNSETILKYKHQGIQVVQIKDHLLFILEEKLAGKIEKTDDGIIIADTYYVENIEQKGNTISFKTQMLNESKNDFYYYGDTPISSVTINQKSAVLKTNLEPLQSSFIFDNPKSKPVKFSWQGNWKIKSDTDEINNDYDDSKWMVLQKPISLEEAGLLEHGYLWYRMEFDLPSDAKNPVVLYPGNNTDRQYLYLNGQRAWMGITDLAVIEPENKIKTGKNIITVLYENFYHNKSHPHEGELLKYSGILKPVVVEYELNNKKIKKEISSFKVRPHLTGILESYTKLDYNDSDWQEVNASPKYIFDESLGEIIWMRRKFKMKTEESWKFGVKLTIPDALHRCFMYINGNAVGWFEAIGPQYDFYVPETFLQEENILTIIAEGPKGFIIEPKLDTFYEAKEMNIEIKF